jgi:dTDP-4-dehydrorhamnose reductase
MNLVVTGAKGMLGQALARAASDDGRCPVILISRAEADLACKESRNLILDALKQQGALINAAAYTNVNGAETQRDAAWLGNAVAPAHLARWTAEAAARLVHVSTDYVFRGDSPRPYREEDPVQPLNAYGRSKLAGELAVSHFHPENHAIVRTSWLYGPGGNCFPATILRMAREGKPLRIVSDQVGSPTLTLHLAPILVGLALLPPSPATVGVFHGTNSGQTSWYEYALAILREAGLEQVALSPILSHEFPTPAIRPTMSVMHNTRLPLTGLPSLPHWTTGLKTYISETAP